MTPSLTVTWLRTSCLLLEYAGRTAITDPWFGRTMRGLPVFKQPGIRLSSLPKIDYVFASHLHRDHFDPEAVSSFGHPDLEIVGTRGTARFCRRRVRGGRYRKVWDLWHWEEAQLGPFHITGTPAEHTGPPPPEINMVIRCGEDFTLFFGGDARWSSAYAQVVGRCGAIDLALLPVGGTLIFGKRTTLDPGDAVRVCEVLQPRWALPIHEGGEWLPVPPASWHPGRTEDFEQLLLASPCATVPVRVERGVPVCFSAEGFERGGAG
ncbi:MAG: MBL fold metallo-hydrolase [Myxococcota bacterium]|nr:MBL fold metallo-hydrolase [Myxococcota bacterium]